MCQLHIGWGEIAWTVLAATPIAIPWAVGLCVIFNKIGELLSCLL